MADIYHPAKRTVFILEYAAPYFEDCRIKMGRYLNGAFDTVEELLGKAESDFKNMEMESYGYITLLQIPRSGKSKNLFDFTIFCIDGCWQIKDIIIGEKDMLSSGCGYPGEWHHYLWDENVMASSENIRGLYTKENMKNCVRLSNIELSVNSGYSTLDWLERA